MAKQLKQAIVIDQFRGAMEGMAPLGMPLELAQVDENGDFERQGMQRIRKGMTLMSITFSSPVKDAISFKNSRGDVCIMAQTGLDQVGTLEGSTTPAVWNGS